MIEILNLIRRIFINLIVFFTGLIFVLMPFEFYMRYNLDQYHSYGWIKNNNINDLVNECKSKNIIGIFGDSFVEYYRDTEHNISSKINSLRSGNNVCNFGISGSGIDGYLARYKFASTNLKFDTVIVYLYEGNDFFNVKEVDIDINYSKYDRNYGIIYNFLKQSVVLNIIYRKVIKKYFITNEILPRDYMFDICNFDYDNALHRLNVLKETDYNTYRKFSTGELNVSWLQVALNCPDYFDLISKSDLNTSRNYPYIKKYINEFTKIAEKNNTNIVLMIIPHDYFLSQKSKENWVHTYQFDYYDYMNKTKISKKLMDDFDNVFYADILTFEDYIELDGHLTSLGNDKLAKFTNNIIIRNF